MDLKKVLTVVVGVTGTIGSLAAIAGYLPGKYGVVIGSIATIALALNKSLTEVLQKQQ